MNKQEVIAEISAIGFPAGEYLIVGGASMTIRGIRDTSDIDVVVTQVLFDSLVATGWTKKPRPNGQPGLRRGNVEVYLDVGTPGYAPSIDWLLAHAQLVEGVPLVDIGTLLTWKRAYGRDKDARDIELLQPLVQSGPRSPTVA